MNLKTEKLGFKAKEHTILKSIDIDVPSSSFLVVVGPNGAGKSTFIKVLLDRLKPTEGSIRIDGQSPSKFDPMKIGYVPQTKTFDRSFPALVQEFVLSGRDSRWPFLVNANAKKQVMSALKRIDSENLYGKSLTELSGGELQRVYLSRSFIRPRRIMILDEPAAGVDSLGEADLYKILENYYKENDSIIVMVTHDIEVARHHATHVLILNHKQIAFGKPAEVLTQENLNRAFGHSQHSHE